MSPKVQDMPPEGGYQTINVARVPARTYFSGYSMILGYFAMTAFGAYMYSKNYKRIQKEQIEMRSARLAILPLVLAERDREYLKQIRRNRDEEEQLMANVEGWEVGTYFGEPIYKTVSPDKFIDPSFHEYYTHAAYKDYAKRANFSFWR